MVTSSPAAGALPLVRVRTWRVLRSPPLDAAVNMATDEALLRRARRTGEGVLRVYAWSRPALSVGRNQSIRGVYDPELLRSEGVPIVRRPTGGRALLHWREVTYAVAAPADDASLRLTYGAINQLLVSALESLGVAATLAHGQGRLPAPGSAPCFERPADGEVLFGGRKLAGSAQWREHGAFLQHGSILVEDDQQMTAALAQGAAARPAPAATLREALGGTTGDVPTLERVADALSEALGAIVREPPPPLDARELADDVEELVARYESDAWTWRR